MQVFINLKQIIRSVEEACNSGIDDIPSLLADVYARTISDDTIPTAYRNEYYLKTLKGMYPLGNNLWPSFGLGMFCAFDMNISNACPLVLWWGNTEKKDNILDNWYPLLPRRVNVSSESCVEPDNIVYWIERNIMDQYNMCPDCGRSFGLEDDGGNGFCVNCAWKH